MCRFKSTFYFFASRESIKFCDPCFPLFLLRERYLLLRIHFCVAPFPRGSSHLHRSFERRTTGFSGFLRDFLVKNQTLFGIILYCTRYYRKRRLWNQWSGELTGILVKVLRATNAIESAN